MLTVVPVVDFALRTAMASSVGSAAELCIDSAVICKPYSKFECSSIGKISAQWLPQAVQITKLQFQVTSVDVYAAFAGP